MIEDVRHAGKKKSQPNHPELVQWQAPAQERVAEYDARPQRYEHPDDMIAIEVAGYHEIHMQRHQQLHNRNNAVDG